MTTYWIIIDNRPAGPFDIPTLQAMGLNPASMVWREGMPDWARAESVDELAALFASQPEAEAEIFTTEAYEATPGDSAAMPVHEAATVASAPYGPGVSSACSQEPCPPTYLGWSIAVTLLCCTVLGIVAIIFSAMVKSSYAAGNLARAKSQSEWAQWMIILAITLGIVCWPFQLAFMLM